MKKIRLAVFLTALLLAPAARADYKYANAEGEYIMSLPDAPLGQTIWAQEGNVPLVDNPPKYGAVGEYALMKRVDPDTNDLFEVRITFVKADRDFLLNLKKEKMKADLERLFADVRLENKKFNFSQGADTLKWATYSGFSVSQNNDALFNIAHYLVGEESVMTVKITYSTQSPQFTQYYKDLAKSITYMGK
jgi:hypothetical protein